MVSSRQRELRPEDSWRFVEGENDSFDTSILPSLGESSPPTSSGNFPSQPFSQGNISFASQDSIRDFGADADDEQVILREPFRPSLSRASVSANGERVFRTPDPEFHMPRLDASVEGSSRSERTIRGLGIGHGGDEGVRRRGNPSASTSSQQQRMARARYDAEDEYYRRQRRDEAPPTVGRQLAQNIPTAIYNTLGWFLNVIGLAFRYAQKPFAILLSIYLCFGGLIIAQNMATRSIAASLSPICRIPGASILNLPFCPSPDAIVPPGGDVEFDDLMSVQSKFEQVLEKSSDGVSLPFEMKRSETAIRDLRSLVRHSDLQARDELLFEFDGYVDTARQTAADLQKFNTHVGSAVDAVISINRWTSRYLDTLAPEADDAHSLSLPSPIFGWASWLFHPFQPTTEHIFNERVLLDKYIEHTALVSDRISTLILEAQAVLRLLTKAEDHLMLIYDISSRSSADTASRRENVLWNIWTLVGANSNQLNSLSRQLALLRQVDAQRSSAVAQVNALILELESIQAGLGDLRDRVAEPEVLRNGIGGSPPIPLSVHIETIDRGVERLEDARSRIRAAENDRVRDALARGGVRNEALLEGQGK
ncbi:hypothetical protein FLAG1_02705 [Fusarium langsethiae]|uniref:Uncharacterized protein n=1 Tax=Fusarium langsethiae TaxID=179993 RepID=A0A0N0DGQ9_FUSLA|nr:hypothetical protein FLAG1_02705 [Fusarium langsethiae]GKU00528.1 unnamed protein product [Fusarium langsethiae]GKU17191.1 unnamed protein product [Fusarium langsethiae]